MEEKEKYISVQEFSEEWNIADKRSIDILIKEGLPHKKINDNYLFNLEKCQRWYRRYAW